MVPLKVFAPLFAMALAAVANASPLASPEANALSGIAVPNNPNCSFFLNLTLFRNADTVDSRIQLVQRGVRDTSLRELRYLIIPLNAPATVEKVYRELQGILGHLVAGGQVSDNVNISSAVILPYAWDDSASLAEINTVRHEFQTSHLAILEQLSGPNAGSYSNEADMFLGDDVLWP
ncbi:hypothetical protein DFH08DRAFT_959820 [Mycena albidolilacea]|uniref:Uncharacterized protein n=1 Tax=Mycena albidolilacea TaxID=1033008 RepID=A0AAD7ESC9_9AGAR|nr:hypothetical protein DFH08DRAFT_959820 [Mycena albidolilacea]